MFVLPADSPKWLEIANAELGVHEAAGGAINPRIAEYYAAVGLHPSDDEVAWCSAFANFCMQQAGLSGSGSAAARSWLRWGRQIDLTRAQVGDVAVFWRDSAVGWKGHVAFFVGAAGGNLLVLGGNQGNAVSV